jgi:hypothetical protein
MTMNDIAIDRLLAEIDRQEDDLRTLEGRPVLTARSFRIKAHGVEEGRKARLQALEVAKARYGAAA